MWRKFDHEVQGYRYTYSCAHALTSDGVYYTGYCPIRIHTTKSLLAAFVTAITAQHLYFGNTPCGRCGRGSAARDLLGCATSSGADVRRRWHHHHRCRRACVRRGRGSATPRGAVHPGRWPCGDGRWVPTQATQHKCTVKQMRVGLR